MKKILFAFSTLALLTGISSSCQKEEMESSLQDNQNNNELTITATIADNGTKVAYAEDGTTHALKPTWEVDDIIIGFDGSGNTYGYKVKTVNAGVATLSIITSSDEKSEYKGSVETNPANDTKMYMFYAPGKKPSDISSKTLTVSLANQSKDVVPALMMASATVSAGNLTLSFENKCAIIGIKNPTMAAASAAYNSITLYGTGIKTEVKFSLNEETLQANYQTAGTITKSVEFTSGSDNTTSGVTYIAVCPLETSADLTFVTNYLETFKKTGKTMSAGNYYYMTPTFAGGHTVGLLPGVFSVGATKVVGFSQGNLQATVNASGTPTAWNFAADQYGYIGKAVANNSIGTTAGVVDLFGWSTNATSNNWGIHTKTGTTPGWTDGSFKDWGDNAISNGGNTAGLWKTLTKDECTYLLNTRTSSTVNGVENARYCKSTVNSIAGLILFPDNYTHPAGVAAPTRVNEPGANKAPIEFTVNIYTSDDWTKMESAGCVFLPSAHYRLGSDVAPDGSDGHYWSSTPNKVEEAYSIYFYQKKIDPEQTQDRHYGYSVRLVCAAQ